MPSNGIEERLQNLECQLSLTTPVSRSIYNRLKEIEDRLLHLESISPEYVQFWVRKVGVFTVHFSKCIIYFRIEHPYRRNRQRKKCFHLMKLMNLLVKLKND